VVATTTTLITASQHVLMLGVFWLVYKVIALHLKKKKVIAFAGRYCSFIAHMGSRHGGKHITDDAPVPPRYGSLLLLLNFYDRA
jgi:hypothetical protein